MRLITIFFLLASVSVKGQLMANNALLKDITVNEIFRNYAFFAYDFTNLTGADGASISNGNAGLEDISANNRDATIVGTPLVEELSVNGSTLKTLEDLSTNAVSIGSNGTGIFNRDAFRIHMVLYIGDGQPSATTSLMGGIIPTNIGINVFLSTTGLIGFQWGNATGVYQWRSNTVFQNGVNGMVALEILVNHNTDAVIMRVNGESIQATLFSGSMSAVTPTTWSNTSNIYIGSLNNNGTAGSNPTSNSILFASAIPYHVNFNQDRAIDNYFYKHFFRWENEIHITDESSANSLRSTLIAEVFNGSGLPTTTPTITTGVSGNLHICESADITDFSSIDKYSFAKTDVDGFTWTNVGYLLHTSATPNNKLIINIQGHISDSDAAHEDYMSQALALGYDVYFCALPVASNDNTETNPTVTGQSTTGHDQIKTGGLDDGTYNALELFLFDKIAAVNEFENDYDEIYMNGISGGGWCTTMCAALDTRISKAVAVRGYKPRSFRDIVTDREGDYEQGGSMFTQVRTTANVYNSFSAVSFIDLVIMATTGNRIFHSTSHRLDDCCFVGLTYDYWTGTAAAIASDWSGDFKHTVDTDVSRATHAYSTFDIAEIFATYDTP